MNTSRITHKASYEEMSFEMALKTNVKVVPVGIQGSFKPFTKVKFNYGKPLDFNIKNKNPEKEQLDVATKQIMDNIIMLTKETK